MEFSASIPVADILKSPPYVFRPVLLGEQLGILAHEGPLVDMIERSLSECMANGLFGFPEKFVSVVDFAKGHRLVLSGEILGILEDWPSGPNVTSWLEWWQSPDGLWFLLDEWSEEMDRLPAESSNDFKRLIPGGF